MNETTNNRPQLQGVSRKTHMGIQTVRAAFRNEEDAAAVVVELTRTLGKGSDNEWRYVATVNGEQFATGLRRGHHWSGLAETLANQVCRLHAAGVV